MSSFNSQYPFIKNKLHKLYEDLKAREFTANLIVPLNKTTLSISTFKNTTEVIIPTTPQLYDLYDFLGATAQYGEPAPEPESAYTQDENRWFFKYPATDFRVPQGQTPAELTGTQNEQWEYVSTIAVVNQVVFLYDMNEQFLNYIKLKSYLSTENTEPVSSEDFSEIYRWNKENNGYGFYYNAFFTIDPDKTQAILFASLMLSNEYNFDALQKVKLI